MLACMHISDMVDALLAEDVYDKAQPIANAFGMMLDEPILVLEERCVLHAKDHVFRVLHTRP